MECFIVSRRKTAWKAWARDVDAWLTEAQVLDQTAPEKLLAQEPKLRDGARRLGLFQTLEERQARRLVRRLLEARFLQHRGKPDPAQIICWNFEIPGTAKRSPPPCAIPRLGAIAC